MNGLDTIKSVNFIAGEVPGSSDGEKQFRIFVDLKEGAHDFIMNAKNFYKVPGHGDDYPDSRQEKGGAPSIQFSMSSDGCRADIDVDYESKNPLIVIATACRLHCVPSNSDVRAGNHFDKHNKRFGEGPAGKLTRRYKVTTPK